MSSLILTANAYRLVWISFCFFGQPVAAIAYFFAWQAKYGSDNKPEWPLQGLGKR